MRPHDVVQHVDRPAVGGQDPGDRVDGLRPDAHALGDELRELGHHRAGALDGVVVAVQRQLVPAQVGLDAGALGQSPEHRIAVVPELGRELVLNREFHSCHARGSVDSRAGMETVRLILGSKAFATIAGGSLLMILGAALGVAIGSDPSSSAATTLSTITKNGTTRIVAVSAKPKTVDHKVKVTVTKKKTVKEPGGTSVHTVTGPTHTVTDVRTRTVTTTRDVDGHVRRVTRHVRRP